MYRGFRVPVIRVKDNMTPNAESRILGTDSHDAYMSMMMAGFIMKIYSAAREQNMEHIHLMQNR